MDPNAALATIRLLMEREADWQEAIEIVAGLDEWLSKGGFLPDAWMPEGRTLIRHGSKP